MKLRATAERYILPIVQSLQHKLEAVVELCNKRVSGLSA